MSFSAEQIRAMLEEYEAEHHTRMDLTIVAQDIYGFRKKETGVKVLTLGDKMIVEAVV